MYSKKQLESYSDFFEFDFTRKPKKRKGIKNNSKDLLIGDIHAPFHHEEMFNKTITDNLEAKNLWIAGDWWDFYSKSFYRKDTKIEFHVEFRDGFSLLWDVADKFDNVYLMLSNHDMRFCKWLFDNVPLEALPFTDHLFLERIIKTIPNVKIIKQPTTLGDRNIGYLHQYKNIVLSHIEMSRKDVGKVVQDICKELQRWETTFNLKDYDMLFQAHNHQSAKVRYGDKYLFQIPCLIDASKPSFNYAFSGKLQGNPPALGYIVLNKNKDGSFNPNSSYIVDL